MARPTSPRRSRTAPTAPTARIAPIGRPRTQLDAVAVLLWLLAAAMPLVLDPSAGSAFRQSKLWVAELLAVASLVVLAWRLRRLERPRPDRVVLLAVAPWLLVATISALATGFGAQVRLGFAHLAIALVVVAAWALGVRRATLERAFAGLLVSATLLGGLALLQYSRLYQPFQFVDIDGRSRLEVTSLAGNPGHLAGFLALAALVAQERLGQNRRRFGSWLALAVSGAALAVTQTLAAFAAFAAGSAVLWALRLPRRRVAMAAAALAVVAGLAVAGVAPIRARVFDAIDKLDRFGWNSALSGRLDGWRAALWMAERWPLLGVGPGGFRSHYLDAKESLLAEGAVFYRAHTNVVFAEAHNEPLQTLAETGWLGLAALVWGIALWLRRACGPAAFGRDRARASFAAGFAALAGVLAIGAFPFQVAISGYPLLLGIAWGLAPPDEGPES